ncbi:hypothetical protein GGF46_003310 [Coemansia sp. RSA 552]|nr:hypothetical protein GGF46_003310 [Coemansia sp. RSA 552]
MRLHYLFRAYVFVLSGLAVAVSNTAAKPNSMRIIHTNDIHAHYSPFNRYGASCTANDTRANTCFGGAARLQTIIGELRSGHSNALLLDAGDQAQGTLFYTVGKFNTTVKVMEQLRYDAMCLGNHEFDDGPELLAAFLGNISFPAVCANIDTSKNPRLARVVRPYIIFERLGLGIIGFITNTAGAITNAGPSVSFSDAADAVNRYVQELQAMGIRRIIALSHNGYHEDIDVAARTHGLGLIVGGHSHTYLSANASDPTSSGPYPTAVKNLDNHTTHVVQAKAWGEYVGFVDLVFGSDGSVAEISGHPVHMAQEVSEDPQMAANVREWRRPLDRYGKTVVGRFAADADNSQCKVRECALGDVFADALLWAAARRLGEQADLALLNGGAVRTGIAQGPVTAENVMDMFPFGNSLVIVDIPGEQLTEAIAGVLAGTNKANHKPTVGFIQVAGIQIRYRTAGSEKALESIEIGRNDTWSPLDDHRVYKVATLDYVAGGGDNILAEPIDAPALDLASVILEDYLREQSPITPRLSSRIADASHKANENIQV